MTFIVPTIKLLHLGLCPETSSLVNSNLKQKHLGLQTFTAEKKPAVRWGLMCQGSTSTEGMSSGCAQPAALWQLVPVSDAVALANF